MTGKDQELYQLQRDSKLGKTKRNFGEIQSNEDFKERCLSYKKACGIALLPATSLYSYDAVNFQEHVKLL